MGNSPFDRFGDITVSLRELETILSAGQIDLQEIRAVTLLDEDATYLPNLMPKLSHLESLTISQTRLLLLPKQLVQHRFLRSLFLSDNKLLKELHFDLGEFKQLEQFVVEGAAITHLPSFAQAMSISLIVARSCGEFKLAPNQLELPELVEVNFEGGRIETIDFSGWKTPRLSRLNLSLNHIHRFPESESNLKESLGSLRISCNPLHQLPDSLSDCKQLRSIEMQDCQFESIPDCLWELPYLFYLDMRRNSISQDKIESFISHRAQFPTYSQLVVKYD